MKYFCYQGNEHDCGFASLKMLLAILNKNKSFLYLKKTNKKANFTFMDLIEEANKHDLKLCGYEYSKDQLRSIKTPFLTVIDCNHCVLVKRIGRKNIEIYDPGKGILIMRESKFEERWSGKVLEVQNFIKNILKLKSEIIMPIKRTIFSSILSLVGISFLIIGFFFVKRGEYVFIPIIFLSLFAICELVEKWYLIKEINFFDKLYIPKYFANRNNGVKSAYQDYISFKKEYFSIGRKMYIAFIIICVVTVTLIMNNPINGIAILFLLALTIFEKVFGKDKALIQYKNISDLENTLIKDNNANLIRDLLFINQNASNYALRISLKKCINTFIIVILSFLLMIFSGEISVNFILFHFGIYYILMENMDEAVSFKDNYENYKMSKARFLDLLN